MDGCGGGGVRPAPIQPTAAGGEAAGPDDPCDARVVREILLSMGLDEGEYETCVVHQILDLAYRYAGDVLDDTQVYANHARKP
ncbi:transcription initiation factor TFIID subunit 9-like [Hordeum vulgare]|nr:transcription initiation factor TFIID subunit 9-like [Hordeum vulgare]